MAATLTTPLLAGVAPDPPPMTRLQRGAVTAFSVLRFLRGVSLIVYPKFGLYALDVEPTGSAYMLTSLIGVRDLLIAGLLYTADSASRLELSRALVVNLLSDAMDAFLLIFYTAWSSNWGNPLAVIIVTAAMAIFEHLTLWSLSEIDQRSEPRARFEEIKASRMSAWLRELRRCEQPRPASPFTTARREGDIIV
ncbi:Fc.00g080840.m01.CDS01 [Cosmosporella sp. VM-42]